MPRKNLLIAFLVLILSSCGDSLFLNQIAEKCQVYIKIERDELIAGPDRNLLILSKSDTRWCHVYIYRVLEDGNINEMASVYFHTIETVQEETPIFHDGYVYRVEVSFLSFSLDDLIPNWETCYDGSFSLINEEISLNEQSSCSDKSCG